MQRFVRPEDVDAELAYKADQSSEEVRVDVGLVAEAVVAAAKWVHVQWIESTPRSVVGPQSCLVRCPKTKCLKVSLAVSSLNNIANGEAVPKGTYFLLSQNALASVASHTSTLCQHGLWGLLVV